MSKALQNVMDAREKVKAGILPALLEAFPGQVEEIPPTPDEIPQVWAAVDAALAVAEWLKAHGFNMLVDIVGADYWPNREPRFEVVYIYRQLPGLGMIKVRVRCSENDQVPSLSGAWPMANGAEREVFDQFGVPFKGHPNLTRILNPDDWEGHPLRRDYPVRGPRGLLRTDFPADRNRYRAFVDEEEEQDGK